MANASTSSVSSTLARLAYTCVLLLVTPFLFVLFLVELISGKASFKRLERFGVIKQPERRGGILVHCVSVGEVVAASKLINELLSVTPELVVTITTTTPTGAERVNQIYGQKVNHVFLPVDLPWAMHALLSKVAPEEILVTEVELWPNMIHAAYVKSIPIFIVNGRMTDSSSRTYGKISALFDPMLDKISHVCAQGKRDQLNYKSLGLSEHKLTLTNNIKFDISPTVDKESQQRLHKQYNPATKTVILAGSTHDPEEKVLLASYKVIKQDFPDTVLLLVPRHPQRFDKVWQLCKQSGFTCSRSSEAKDVAADIILVDEMGVLADLYSIADIAFVGGSLADRGGHNALEAAIYEVPSIMGPNTYNNPEICSVLQQANGLHIVNDEEDLSALLAKWLAAPSERKRAGQAAACVVKENQGAIRKTLAVVTPLAINQPECK